MTAYEPALGSGPGSILRNFRNGLLRPMRGAAPPNMAQLADPDAAQLHSISQFLLSHGLEISPYTLGVAYDYVTGGDPQLARQIDAQLALGQEISLDWLEEKSADSADEAGIAMLSEVIQRLERNLASFGASAQAARSATRDYNCALAEHGRELKRDGGSQRNVEDLVRLVSMMIDRTRDLEQEMSRSEEQSRSMREDLDRAQRMADEDFLTGLPNRRAFEQCLKQAINAAKQTGEILCLAFCDIDHFKQVNDVHGHAAGDRVIRAVAERLAGICDDQCHVARHGGEEFVVLFRSKSAEQARAVLENAREQIASRRMINRETKVPIGTITFSAGIAAIDPDAEPRDALKRADQALYRAKEQGRDQVVIAD